MALIAAVSDLSIFFDMVKGITIANDKINSRSEGEKSPSGPMRIVKFLLSLKSEIFNLSFEFKSANNSLVELSKLSKKSFSLTTSEISGGESWLDCSVASTTIF